MCVQCAVDTRRDAVGSPRAEKDERGRAATGVAADVEKSMRHRESLSFNITFSDRDRFEVTITKKDVQKCIEILAEDSSDED